MKAITTRCILTLVCIGLLGGWLTGVVAAQTGGTTIPAVKFPNPAKFKNTTVPQPD
jgi:hypothetical protein